MSSHRYFAVHKPYNMLSQFIGGGGMTQLCDLDFPFPEGIHAIGRLDNLSEGLLLLTTNKRVTKLLFQGEVPHRRVYLVQVYKTMSEESLAQLHQGVSIRIKGGGYHIATAPDARLVSKPAGLYSSGYEFPEQLPHSWLEISLTEGKYHQVRKMVTAIRHPCKRLIRTSIEDIELGDLPPGAVREYTEADFFRLLHINYQPDPGDSVIFAP
jgi:23S rRNA pseudouridine2457 synthase